MKAVILAAGKGTRLHPYSKILPKALMPIGLNSVGGFQTIIEKLIEQCVLAGIKDIVVIINYKGELIQELLGDGSELGCSISYETQDVLDGNAGAFYRAQHRLGNEDVFVTDCDNYLSEDEAIREMRQMHEEQKNDLTVGVCTVSNIRKFAIIKTEEGKPVDIYEKPEDESVWGNLAKSGMMILSNKLAMLDRNISKIEGGKEVYTTTQIVKYVMVERLPMTLFSFDKGFNDIGTWEEYIPILRNNLK